MSEHKHNHDECHGECCCHEHEHEHDHDGDCECCCHDHGDDCGCGCGHDHGDNGKSKWLRLGIAFALLIGGVVTSMLAAPQFVCVVLYAAAYMVAGFEVIIGAVKGIAKGDIFGENFLMSIASLGAFAIGEYAEACAVMLLFELGERFQNMAVSKSRGSIRAMLEMRPEKIILIRDGKEIEAKPSDAHIGDVILVCAGDKIACDGEIIEGSGDVDMQALTGESLPVSKVVGDSVLAGSISIDATLRIRVSEEYDNSTVSRILEMIEHAKSKKSPTESFIRKFSRIYTPIVCALALLVAVVPPTIGLGEFSTWLYRGLCALAASCPCALVISVPFV